jgi:hypothetical protein
MTNFKIKRFEVSELKQKNQSIATTYTQNRQSIEIVKTSLILDESNNLMLDFSKPINSQYLVLFIRKLWR